MVRANNKKKPCVIQGLANEEMRSFGIFFFLEVKYATKTKLKFIKLSLSADGNAMLIKTGTYYN